MKYHLPGDVKEKNYQPSLFEGVRTNPAQVENFTKLGLLCMSVGISKKDECLFSNMLKMKSKQVLPEPLQIRDVSCSLILPNRSFK